MGAHYRTLFGENKCHSFNLNRAVICWWVAKHSFQFIQLLFVGGLGFGSATFHMTTLSRITFDLITLRQMTFDKMIVSQMACVTFSDEKPVA